MVRIKGAKNKTQEIKTLEQYESRNVLPAEGLAINDTWMLKSDDLNIILMRKRDKTHHRSKGDSISYETFYYNTISGALQAVLDKEVKGTGLKSVQEVNNRITKIEQEIKTAIAAYSTVALNNHQNSN